MDIRPVNFNTHIIDIMRMNCRCDSAFTTAMSTTPARTPHPEPVAVASGVADAVLPVESQRAENR